MPSLPLLFPLLLSLVFLHTSCSSRPPSSVTNDQTCAIPFRLQGLEPTPFEPQSGAAAVDLVFTGPPDPESLLGTTNVLLEGTAVEVTLSPRPDDPSTIQARFALDGEGWTGLALARVTVHLDEGTRCAGNPALLAPSAHLSVDLVTKIPPVSLRTASVHESDDGHYLQVLCQDHSLEQSWSTYREGGRWTLSQRCMPDLEAGLAGIRVEPPTPLQITATRGGFLIYGDFERGPLGLVIEAGTRTLDGGRFVHEERIELEIPELTPRLSFLSQGRYLPRGALERLGIRHRNVQRARLEVRHVPTENLVFWMSGREPTDRRSSNRVLLERIDLDGEQDREHTTWLDLDQRLPSAKNGLYEITLHALDPDEDEANEHDHWWYGGRFHEARASARVLMTDMQLVAKRMATVPGDPWASELMVWALDTHGAGLLQDVDMELVRPSGTAMGRCTTDSRGGCRIHVARDAVEPEPPFAIVARRGSDVSYLTFEDLALEPHGDVHGEPFLAESQVRAAAWTDRGVYRPGDDVHVAAILRGIDDLAPPAGLPVTMIVQDPRGQQLRRWVLETNAAGLLTGDLSLRDYARTGRYQLRLEVAEREIGSARFLVEEIAPERMEVALEPDDEDILEDQAVALGLDARWLFGAAAAGSRVELDCTLQPGTFAPFHNPHLHYGLSDIAEGLAATGDLATREGTLDDRGHLRMSCPEPALLGDLIGPARLAARVAVFEGASGRATRARAAVRVHPERFYIGLDADQAQVRAGVPVRVQGLLVDWEGQPLAEAAERVVVRVMRVEREYGASWDEATQDFRYGSWYRRVEEKTLELDSRGGTLDFPFTPAERAWGYLVVATAGGARSELLLEAEDHAWARSGLYDTPDPERAGRIEVQAPDEVHPGERVPVSVQVADAGWLLLTAETDRVLEHRWMKVRPGTATWSFRLADYTPNVYVSALLVRDPHRLSASAYQPGRAHGLRSVRVKPEPFEGQLTLSVPDEVRPGSTLEIDLELDAGPGPAWVTVAAVDEGLLSLTRHPSPDPLPALFQPRALGVDSFETVGWALALPSLASTSSAGGDFLGRKARVQTIEPVALWSGLVEVPASGRLTVPLEVPSYRGSLRVMAVGATSRRVARADARVPVREPLLVQVTAPRFLIEGDRARVPVAVSNLSERDREVKVDVSVGPLPGRDDEWKDEALAEIVGGAERELLLEMGDRAGMDVELAALAGAGGFQLRVTATSGDLLSQQSVMVPLAAPLPTEHEVTRIPLGTDTQDLASHTTGWRAARGELWITTNPYADVLEQLEDLLHYPYGCLEQTSSQTRALVALGGLLEGDDLQRPLDEWVQAGIDRVQVMQIYGGGFGYWPGSSEPSPWASAYALHVLLDASAAGHPVPEGMLSRGLGYLERQLERGDGEVRAYAHYVLARAGRGQAALARSELAGTRNDRESAYLLMAAVHLTGDHRYEGVLTDLGEFTDRPAQRRWQPYGSSLREQGLVLATFREVFGAHAAGQALTDAVAAGLRAAGSRHATTQELAWGLTGLASSVGPGTTDSVHPVLVRNGGQLATAPGTTSGWVIDRLAAPGTLEIHFDHDGEPPLWMVLDATGIRVDGQLPQSQGAIVQRRVLTAEGEPAELDDLEVGQLVFVSTQVQSLLGSQPNVAIVDRLPAGWEVENPTLTGTSLPNWLDTNTLWAPEHLNLRDDRLEAFGSIDQHPRVLVYAVRVVTAGSFTQPGVQLEAMYDPGVRARTEPTRVIVQPRAGTELL